VAGGLIEKYSFVPKYPKTPLTTDVTKHPVMYAVNRGPVAPEIDVHVISISVNRPTDSPGKMAFPTATENMPRGILVIGFVISVPKLATRRFALKIPANKSASTICRPNNGRNPIKSPIPTPRESDSMSLELWERYL
jgi:hypothetical protein